MAYAAVASLMQNLEQLLRPNPYLCFLETDQIESLYKELCFIQAFLEDSDWESDDHEMVKKLEGEIRDVGYAAEDFIDSHVFNAHLQKYRRNPKKTALVIQQSLPEILDELKSIKKEVIEIYDKKKKCGIRVLQVGNSSVGGLSRSTPNEAVTLVGLEEDVTTILDRLTGLPSQLEIISVVGMGGIGKTTLTRKVYNDPYVMHRFDVRAWMAVSQKYQKGKLLLGLLGCLTQLTDEVYKKSNEQLGEVLHKMLKGRRYLIVMDDMWSTQAWDDLKRSFPNDNNGSRIVLTSRLTEVAAYVNTNSPPHRMHFLSIEKGWKLLREKVFLKESCPAELEGIGKKIVEKCHGLPLAVVVVAGLLSKISKTRESWEKVRESVGSLVTRDPEQFLDILALSYNHLPHRLKACFLYMGVFLEDSEIHVWRLIWLWVAEGFLPTVRTKSLEEVAEEYLEELIDRSLILVASRRSNGRVKTCRIHDLLRNLCLREAMKENFLYAIGQYVQVPPIDPKKNCVESGLT